MNAVMMIGRLTKNPQTTYGADNVPTLTRITVAIDRGKGKGADFPSCVAFGKTAELIDKYFHKGDRIGVMGRLTTGSYEKDGKKIYTTDVVAERIDFLNERKNTAGEEDVEAPHEGFNPLANTDFDIPF